MRMYKVLKDNQNKIVKLKQLSPNKKLPSGLLQGGNSAIERALSSFKEAKRADKVNESRPDAKGKKNNNNNSPKKKTPIFFRKGDNNNNNTNKKAKTKKTKVTKSYNKNN
mmetsp:Transcript_10078/g.12534  ORF Transcript_10078/g.12534 Transcript_10078/m.12534 type:complete len:110 (-) Transcript_10078:31-360(-)